MTPRHPARALAWLLCGAFAACPSASFEHTGPNVRRVTGVAGAPDALRAEALPPPRLVVAPADAGTRWFVDATVVGHDAGTDDAGYVLRLRITANAEAGAVETGDVEVRYDLGDDLQIPTTVGQAVRFRYYGPEQGYAEDSGAFILTSASGLALAVIVRRDRLPAGILPGETAIGASAEVAHLAYTEVIATDAMCHQRVDHFDLRVASEQHVELVVPGTRARVAIDRAPFEIVAFDASRRVGSACAGADPAHTSYALIRVVSAE